MASICFTTAQITNGADKTFAVPRDNLFLFNNQIFYCWTVIEAAPLILRYYLDKAMYSRRDNETMRVADGRHILKKCRSDRVL
uniref:Uncharacterized protein n=1 Tax=Romanomermis culicivorax TaxID=13658 RepID=A0A915KH01_ROMCU